jgi:hypothetical protein
MTSRSEVASSSGVEPSSKAARALYEAELALHDAHQTHVDAWIAAAADRLHAAVLRYEAVQVRTAPATA